jgi:hypothetical protein
LPSEAVGWQNSWRVVPSCENIILKYAPSIENRTAEMFEIMKEAEQLKIYSDHQTHYDVKHFWIFSTQFLRSLGWNNIVYTIPRDSYCSAYLDRVSVFTIYHRVPIREYVPELKNVKVIYNMIFEDYMKNIPLELFAQPTHHNSGLFVMSTYNQLDNWGQDCNVSVLMWHYSISPYVTPMLYNTDMFISYYEYMPWYNKWRMCRRNRCYMVHDYLSDVYYISWTQVEEFCEVNQGHLFTANSEAEQRAVIQWVMTKRRRMHTIFYGYLQHYSRANVIFLGLRADQVIWFWSMVPYN